MGDHFAGPCINWKLLLIWLIGFGDLLAIISCKKVANGYNGLSKNEVIIREGQSDLCIFGRA